VSFHFGLPDAAVIQSLKQAGVFLMASATSLDEARQIEAAGMDAIVAQGIEAGGHRGIFDQDKMRRSAPSPWCACWPAVLPVIAAGGIMDGKGIAAALQLGAQAVQMGTAFLLTRESGANAAYRDLLKSPRPAHA
jgi:nitronate monooxygenase